MRDDKLFDSASYIIQLQYNYMKVTFENASPINIWYNIKKALNLT